MRPTACEYIFVYDHDTRSNASSPIVGIVDQVARNHSREGEPLTQLKVEECGQLGHNGWTQAQLFGEKLWPLRTYTMAHSA
jgi:hypothetical protein